MGAQARRNHDPVPAWERPITLSVAGWMLRTDLHQVINDGLMAVFFFVVGLEIKREVLAGV